MFFLKFRFAICVLFLTATAFSQSDSSFVALTSSENKLVFDLKYATSENFLKASVYDCSTCFLRQEAAIALKKAAAKAWKKHKLRLKLFDCYRPLAVQERMFALVPNPDYVADPKKGSIHNRGAAVDLTLIDENGVELDMGTSFDHFGEEAAHAYENLTETQKSNRKKLLSIMKSAGFKPLPSEWWHYNYGKSRKFNISNANLCSIKEDLNKVDVN